jgi:tRNA nucleotidyltransferase (CCA-adding enzyme)
MQIYRVGGAVRDRLLGITAKENDWVVVGASADDLLTQGFKPVGKDFPVFLHPQTGEEYALARTERKTAPGYHGFTFHADPSVTLEEDLLRRDLTINAMAEDADGTLIDPYNGEEDLRAGVLRHVSPAFAEDPVRILRIARFAARFARWGFHVAHGTHALMKRMIENGEVDALVAERVWQETRKALEEDIPSRFFEVLHKCDALERIFPELARLFGVPQPAHHHPEIDTGIHTLMVLDAAAKLSPDPRVRFAALVHDLGKGTTPKEEWPKHHGHEQRSVKLVRNLCERLKTPQDYRELAELVAQYHGHYHRVGEMRADTTLNVLEKIDAFRRPERFELWMLACEADQRGRPGYEDQDFYQGPLLRACYDAARSIDVQSVIADGHQGVAIQEELHRRRTAAVEKILHNANIAAEHAGA